jgi:hypothetical protein
MRGQHTVLQLLATLTVEPRDPGEFDCFDPTVLDRSWRTT